MAEHDFELSDALRGLTFTKPAKVLMKDGVWLVPEAERPKGWEKLGKQKADAPARVPAKKKGKR